MTKWETKQIKQLGRVVTGKTPPKNRADYYEGDNLFVSPKDFEWDGGYVEKTQTTITDKAIDAFKNQVLPRNAILFTSLSYGFGKMAIASKSLLTNQQINSVIANEDHDFRFIYYLLRAYTPIIFSYNSGIDTPIVPKSVFEKIEVSCPDLKLQRKIASILAAYDDLIEINKYRIALLEKMAEEFYREWFVRMRFPGHQNTKFVKGLPSNWQIARIGDVVSFDKGLSYAGKHLCDEHQGIPMVNLKCFRVGGHFRKMGVKFYDGAFRPQHVVHSGDIVLANTDLTQAGDIIGAPALVPDLNGGGKMIISHHLCAVRLGDYVDAKYFFYQLLLSQSFKGHAFGFANGATVLGLRTDDIERFPFLVPEEQLMEKFSEVANPIYDEILSLNKVSEILLSARALLLPRLVSGKLSVEDLDIQFPPSMQEEATEPESAYA